GSVDESIGSSTLGLPRSSWAGVYPQGDGSRSPPAAWHHSPMTDLQLVDLDDVLRPSGFAAAVADFPGIDDEFWKGYLHVNETKYCNVYPETWAPALRDVARELTSPEFVSYLEELTGITGLIPDWSM